MSSTAVGGADAAGLLEVGAGRCGTGGIDDRGAAAAGAGVLASGAATCFAFHSAIRCRAAAGSYLRPELAALFPARFQLSELGDIPQGWRVGICVHPHVASKLFERRRTLISGKNTGKSIFGL